MFRTKHFLRSALPLSLLLIGSIPAVAAPITLTLTDYIDFTGSGLPAGTSLTFQVTLPGPLAAYPNPPYSDYFDFRAANLISPLPAGVNISAFDLLLHASTDIDHIDSLELRGAISIGPDLYLTTGGEVFLTPCLQTTSVCVAGGPDQFGNLSTGATVLTSKPDVLTVSITTPEPATMGVAGTGLAFFMVLLRRRSRKH